MQPLGQPPRVLMVVPQYPYPVVGGLERQAHELGKSLVARGVEVQALSGRTSAQQPDLEVVEGVRVHRIPWSASRTLRFLRTPYDCLWVMVRERHSFDLVHTHQVSWFSLFVLLVARLLGKPVLGKVPGVGPYGVPGIAASRLGSWKLALLRRADGVVAMSRQSQMELEAAGIPRHRILLTPNGIHALPLSPPKTAQLAQPCTVVFVGRLSAEKDLPTLFRAWQRLALTPAATLARLELWGAGPQEDELRQLARKLGVTASVTFRGHVEGVRDRLPMADVFVLPSLSEGNSNAVLEAMAAGLPVVSTRVGGTPMQVGQEGAPFLFDPGDDAALHEKLGLLVADTVVRKAIGAAMRRRVLDYFDMSRVAATYEAAYCLLLAGRCNDLSAVASEVIGRS